MIIGSSKPPSNDKITIEESHVSSSIVVDSDVKIDSFVRYIEGFSWSVNYYSKQKAENDIVQPLNSESARIIEQFIKYNNFEIKVKTPIENLSLKDVTGKAVITDIVVNVGDIFTAKLRDNNLGLFRVIEVEHKLYNFKTLFEITYKLDLIKTNTTLNVFNDLESKVIKEKFYDNKAIFTGATPIIDNEVYKYRLNIDKELRNISMFYFNTFFNRELNTILVPDDNYKINDPYMEYFIFKIFNYEHIPFLDRFNRYTSDELSILYGTIYYTLIEQNQNELEFNKNMRALKNKYLHTESVFIKSMRYFGTDMFVELGDEEVENLVDNTGKNIPTFNEKYLFSSNFYKKEKLSLLETLLIDHIEAKTYKVEDISTLIKDYRKWSKKEQFYYIPFLYLLVKQSKVYSYSIGDKLCNI